MDHGRQTRITNVRFRNVFFTGDKFDLYVSASNSEYQTDAFNKIGSVDFVECNRFTEMDTQSDGSEYALDIGIYFTEDLYTEVGVDVGDVRASPDGVVFKVVDRGEGALCFYSWSCIPNQRQ